MKKKLWCVSLLSCLIAGSGQVDRRTCCPSNPGTYPALHSQPGSRLHGQDGRSLREFLSVLLRRMEEEQSDSAGPDFLVGLRKALSGQSSLSEGNFGASLREQWHSAMPSPSRLAIFTPLAWMKRPWKSKDMAPVHGDLDAIANLKSCKGHRAAGGATTTGIWAFGAVRRWFDTGPGRFRTRHRGNRSGRPWSCRTATTTPRMMRNPRRRGNATSSMCRRSSN